MKVILTQYNILSLNPQSRQELQKSIFYTKQLKLTRSGLRNKSLPRQPITNNIIVWNAGYFKGIHDSRLQHVICQCIRVKVQGTFRDNGHCSVKDAGQECHHVHGRKMRENNIINEEN